MSLFGERGIGVLMRLFGKGRRIASGPLRFIHGMQAGNFFRIWIRIRRSGCKNPDQGDPKKTGSDRIRIRIPRYVLMFSKITNCVWHFYSKSKHLMTPI